MMEVVAQQSDNSIFLRCLVVDDEPMAREGMIDLISKVEFLQLSGVCASAMEAMQFMNNHPIDLIFGNYIQSYSITLVKRCKDLLLSNLFITFAL